MARTAVLLLATLAALAAAPAAGASPVPQGFVGVDVDGPPLYSTSRIDLGNQMTDIVASGVQSVRVAFSWADAQPYASWSDVPADQRDRFTVSEPRPTDFSATDQIVADAAQRGLTVLPTILYAPGWDARRRGFGLYTPQQGAPYAQFAAELVGRYGPQGSFWSANPQIPKVPIRMWQIWNEPNLSGSWPQPFARSYVSLLRLAHNAIKQADPGAKVVLGALTNYAWQAIGQIYKVKGARSLFDIAAMNAFSATPAHVILAMRLMRRALIRGGDRAKPLLATELSWPSALGQDPRQNFDFNTTEAGQARNIGQLLGLMRTARRGLGLAGFYYYTWMGDEYRGAQAFNFAGLVAEHDGQETTKPALAAFRTGALALEGCRAKGSTATACLH